jgi:uroporphyrinogen decarboxylase
MSADEAGGQMNDLERFRATMEYQARDRAPFQQFPWPTWPETEERWAREGGYDPKTTDFGLDHWVVEYSWFMPTPPFEREVLSEDAGYVTYVDPQGIVVREFKHNPLSSMPQFVRFPVETRQDFRKFWRERMQPDLTLRIGPDWRERLRRHRNRDYVFVVIADRWGGFFGPPRNLVGLEGLCALFYDDPAFVEEMLEAHADFLIGMLSRILEETDIDVFGFWEDMCYNSGPLLSPALARKFMLPQYRRVVDFGRSRGVKYFGLDSDGRVDLLIPVWMDAGIDILYPFEVQAGQDVWQVRRKFGRQLRIWGGVDKRALIQGRAAIDAEIERRKPLIDDGGYVPTLDHSAPPDISYDNYCYFMERLRAAL